MCPRSSESWCKFQTDKINNTGLYKNKPGLPSVVRGAIKPVFMDLSDNLFKKCLHGQTQNNNELLNGVNWKRCTKDVFVGRSTLEMGVVSAVISFNDGIQVKIVLDIVTKEIILELKKWKRNQHQK